MSFNCWQTGYRASVTSPLHSSRFIPYFIDSKVLNHGRETVRPVRPSQQPPAAEFYQLRGLLKPGEHIRGKFLQPHAMHHLIESAEQPLVIQVVVQETRLGEAADRGRQ